MGKIKPSIVQTIKQKEEKTICPVSSLAKSISPHSGGSSKHLPVRKIEAALMPAKLSMEMIPAKEVPPATKWEEESMITYYAGGVGFSVQVLRVDEEKIQAAQTDQLIQKMKIYPNPAQSGSLITISFPESFSPATVQLFNASGQLIPVHTPNIMEEASVFNLHLPSSLISGIYIIRIVSRNNKNVLSEKIMVR